MTKRLNLVLALAAGLLGGLLSRYIAPPAAFAQNQSPVAKEFRAQSFMLVDPDGRTVATLAPESLWSMARQHDANGVRIGRIVLMDSVGREIWSVGGTPFRTPSER